MENKKLLIIIIILLVIILTILGVITINGMLKKDEEVSKNKTNEVSQNESSDEENKTTRSAEQQMKELEIEMFNSKFEKYEGKEVNGSDVKLLIEEVILSNEQQKDEENIVEINATSDKKELRQLEHKISSGRKYTVSSSKNDEGKIYKIDISEN